MQIDSMIDKTDDIRRYRWLQYFRKIADLYNLRDWVLEMSSDGTEDAHACASMYCAPGRKHGWIRLSQAFLDESAVNQRMIVIHELTHCHNAMEYTHARNYLKEEHKDTHRMLMEYTVDSIALAVSMYFPLPSEETRSGRQHEVRCDRC